MRDVPPRAVHCHTDVAIVMLAAILAWRFNRVFSRFGLALRVANLANPFPYITLFSSARLSSNSPDGDLFARFVTALIGILIVLQ